MVDQVKDYQAHLLSESDATGACVAASSESPITPKEMSISADMEGLYYIT